MRIIKPGETIQITKNYSVTMTAGVLLIVSDTAEINSEDAELISFVSWFKHQYPELADRIMHIPNESMKPVQARVMDKKKGLLDGAPDLIIFMDKITVLMEFKRQCIKSSLRSTKNRQHFERQLTVLSAAAGPGRVCCVVCGFAAGKYFINHLDELLRLS